MGNCNDQGISEEQGHHHGSSPNIEVNIQTWSKNQHGLFDYEDQGNKKVKQVSIERAAQIQLSSGELVSQSADQKGVISISQENEISWLRVPSNGYNPLAAQNSSDDMCYLVVNSIQQSNPKGCKLKYGDFFKLGRVLVKVYEISSGTDKPSELFMLPEEEQQQQTQQNETPLNMSQVSSATQDIDSKLRVCRICLSDSCSESNALVEPCKCSGTMQYIHLDCLKTWINFKQAIDDKKGNLVAFIAKQFQCELCKSSYPYNLEQNGKKYNLLTIPRPKQPYMVLEILKISNKEAQTGFLVLKLKENEVYRIGRSHQCEINFSDISVSRHHASLKYSNGQIYLTDNNSKFGTLLELRNDMAITQDMNDVQLQIGRHLVNFKITHTPIAKGSSAANSNNKCCSVQMPTTQVFE